MRRKKREWDFAKNKQKHLCCPLLGSDHLAITIAPCQSTSPTPSESTKMLNDLYRDFLDIQWQENPSLYRCPWARPKKKAFVVEWSCSTKCRLAKKNRSGKASAAFLMLWNHFHRGVRHAKKSYGSCWLRRVEHMRKSIPASQRVWCIAMFAGWRPILLPHVCPMKFGSRSKNVCISGSSIARQTFQVIAAGGHA